MNVCHWQATSASAAVERSSKLSATLKNDEGQLIAGATVEAEYVDKNYRATLDQMTRRLQYDLWLSEGRGTANRTDAQGRWSIDDYPPDDNGDVVLTIKCPGYIRDVGGWTQQEQHVTIQSLRNGTATLVLHRGITLTGRVTDPQGNPVAGALLFNDDNYHDAAQTDKNGVYRFSPLPACRVALVVVAKSWVPDIRAIKLTADSGPVDFQLHSGRTERIQFVDSDGHPIRRKVAVLIKQWRTVSSLGNCIVDTPIPHWSDANGLFQWTWAPNDAVTYTVYAPSKDGKSGISSEVTVTAVGETHRQSLPLPPN